MSNLVAVCGIRNREQRETNKTHYIMATTMEMYIVSLCRRFCACFVVSTARVHHLRGKYGIYYFCVRRTANKQRGHRVRAVLHESSRTICASAVATSVRTRAYVSPGNNDRRAQGFRPLTVTAASVRGGQAGVRLP